MATERQSPDAILAQTSLSGVVSDIQDDPDAPDANWLIASNNNTNVSVRTSFPSPTGDPSVGADLQEFRFQVRRTAGSGTVDPTARAELWENGVLVRAGGENTVTSDSGQVFAFIWNADELATVDGSLVELKVVGTKSGGAPAKRSAVDVGAVEWNVDFVSGGVFTLVADSGSYSWVGVAALLLASLVVSAVSGAYGWIGTPANFLLGVSLIADPGSYTYTGTPVSFLKNSVVITESGSYSWTGTTANLEQAHILTALSGSHAWAGTDVSFLLGVSMSVEAGSYTFVGSSASLLSSRLIQAVSGSHTWVGTAAALTASQPGVVLVASPGSYGWTGTSAGLMAVINPLEGLVISTTTTYTCLKTMEISGIRVVGAMTLSGVRNMGALKANTVEVT